MAQIKVLATPHNDFPGSYLLNLRADGRLLGIGREPMTMAVFRLAGERLFDPASDDVCLSYTDGTPDETYRAAPIAPPIRVTVNEPEPEAPATKAKAAKAK